MTTEQNLKALLAAFAYCAAAFTVMRFASTHAQNYGPMTVSTGIPFGFAFGLTAFAGFSLARCAFAALFVYLFLLYSIWWSGLEAVGIAPIFLMPFFTFLGHRAGERYLQMKHRG
jgi:hypothetical protein